MEGRDPGRKKRVPAFKASDDLLTIDTEGNDYATSGLGWGVNMVRSTSAHDQVGQERCVWTLWVGCIKGLCIAYR